jgi:hypothetical protein
MGALSLGMRQTVRDADSVPPSSAEVMYDWLCTSTPIVYLHGIYRDTFNFTVVLSYQIPFFHVWFPAVKSDTWACTH